MIPSVSVPILQLKITLKKSNPPIFRRVEVPDNFNLADLHTIVQESMGWDDAHAHQFLVGDQRYMARGIPADKANIYLPAKAILLNSVFLSVKTKIQYDYDFGDNWAHTIELEKILPFVEQTDYPRCTVGHMACPMEDCGGLQRYYHLLEVLQNPTHPDYFEILEWADGDIYPEDFSTEDVNRALKAAFRKMA
jgi:hypothetical protein